MRKNVITIIVIAICVFLLGSCKNESSSYGTLRLLLGQEKTRLLCPATSYQDELSYYELQLTLPDGKLYKATNIRETTVEIKELPIGEYQLVVYGYKDDDETYKAKGSVKFRLYVDDNTVTVPLVFTGNGSFTIKTSFDKTKADFSKGAMSVSFSFYDSNMQEVSFDASSIGQSEGGSVIEATYPSIPSGTYTFKAILEQNEKIISTIIETVIIYPNTSTSGELEFTLGGSVNKMSVAIVPIDNTSVISGTIVQSTSESSDSATYKVNITSKPDYISDSDIKLKWLVNGTMQDGNPTEITVTKADAQRGLVFVSVLIYSDTAGIIGSASTTASFESSFTSANPSFSEVE